MQKILVTEMVGIYPPPAVAAIDQEHTGKDIAEFAGNAGQKCGIQQQPGAQTHINNRHGKAQNQHGCPDKPALAELFVGRHSREKLVKTTYTRADANFGEIGGLLEANCFKGVFIWVNDLFWPVDGPKKKSCSGYLRSSPFCCRRCANRPSFYPRTTWCSLCRHQ